MDASLTGGNLRVTHDLKVKPTMDLDFNTSSLSSSIHITTTINFVLAGENYLQKNNIINQNNINWNFLYGSKI